MYAWEAGKTRITADAMNAFLSMQTHKLIFRGLEITAKTGTGVVENALNVGNLTWSFFMKGTELGSLLIETKKYGQGADLVAELRSGFNPDGSTIGTLIATSFIPKEFIESGSAFTCLPFGQKNLTDKGEYWIVLRQSGDNVNKVVVMGETSQDPNFKTFARNGILGKWTAQNALHFKIMDYTEAGDLAVSITGNMVKWFEWQNYELQKVKLYIPAESGAGIRQIKKMEYNNGLPREGVI